MLLYINYISIERILKKGYWGTLYHTEHNLVSFVPIILDSVLRISPFPSLKLCSQHFYSEELAQRSYPGSWPELQTLKATPEGLREFSRVSFPSPSSNLPSPLEP